MIRKSVTFYDDQYKFFKSFKSEKLLVAFVEFMFEDVEPEGLNEQEQVIFDSLRTRMDNQKKKALAGRNSHGGGRPKKQQKNNKKTTEQTTEKQEDKDISKDILSISNNNLISKDIKGTSSGNYGNPEINECLEIIKSYNNGIIDGTQKQNRIDAKNLISKLKKVPQIASGEFKRDDTLKMILEIISKNKYYSSKITSPGSIYRNLAILFQVCKQEGENQIGEIPVL